MPLDIVGRELKVGDLIYYSSEFCLISSIDEDGDVGVKRAPNYEDLVDVLKGQFFEMKLKSEREYEDSWELIDEYAEEDINNNLQAKATAGKWNSIDTEEAFLCNELWVANRITFDYLRKLAEELEIEINTDIRPPKAYTIQMFDDGIDENDDDEDLDYTYGREDKVTKAKKNTLEDQLLNLID